MVKAGGQASKGFGSGSSIYVFDDEGMLLDLAIGGQKFIFRTAALGRARTTEGALEKGTEQQFGETERPQQGEQESEKTPRHGGGEPTTRRK